MGFDDFFFDATFGTTKINDEDINYIINGLKEDALYNDKVIEFFNFVKSCNSKALRQILLKIFYNFMYNLSPDSTNPRRQQFRDSKNRQLERVNQYFRQQIKKNKSGELSKIQEDLLSECWHFINLLEHRRLYTYKKMANGKVIKIKINKNNLTHFTMEFDSKNMNHIW